MGWRRQRATPLFAEVNGLGARLSPRPTPNERRRVLVSGRRERGQMRAMRFARGRCECSNPATITGKHDRKPEQVA